VFAHYGTNCVHNIRIFKHIVSAYGEYSLKEKLLGYVSTVGVKTFNVTKCQIHYITDLYRQNSLIVNLFHSFTFLI